MEHDRDPDRVSLESLDPMTALRALLAVDPKSEPAETPQEDGKRAERERQPDESADA
jgi:hypothetical protein